MKLNKNFKKYRKYIINVYVYAGNKFIIQNLYMTYNIRVANFAHMCKGHWMWYDMKTYVTIPFQPYEWQKGGFQSTSWIHWGSQFMVQKLLL